MLNTDKINNIKIQYAETYKYSDGMYETKYYQDSEYLWGLDTVTTREHPLGWEMEDGHIARYDIVR